MRKLMWIACAIAVLPLLSFGGEKKQFNGDVSVWSSSTPAGPGIIPVGGAGQINGGFVVSERNGIQIGIRAQERNQGLLPSVRDQNAGVYFAETSSAPGLATWNYDIHVDLRGGFGVAKGKTMSDYTLTLDSDIGVYFGLPFPVELSDFLPGNTVLFQSSENPKFGNPDFDATAEGMYTFTLTLTPKTFNGSPIVARMSVLVQDPE